MRAIPLTRCHLIFVVAFLCYSNPLRRADSVTVRPDGSVWEQYTDALGNVAYRRLLASASSVATSAPYITVLWPVQTEMTNIGDVVNITWTASNFGAAGLSTSMIKVQLCDSDCAPADYVRTITHATPNSGHILWVVDATASSSLDAALRVRISSTLDPSVEALSSGRLVIECRNCTREDV